MAAARSMRRRFTPAANRPAVDVVVRQMEATTHADHQLGSVEAARRFLNGHDDRLGGRPLDIAGDSPDGLDRVREALTHVSGAGRPARPQGGSLIHQGDGTISRALKGTALLTTKDNRMTTETVTSVDADRGHGFIAPEDGGADALVHVTAVERAGMRTLDGYQRVSDELETDRRGQTSAVNLPSADAPQRTTTMRLG